MTLGAVTPSRPARMFHSASFLGISIADDPMLQDFQAGRSRGLVE